MKRSRPLSEGTARTQYAGFFANVTDDQLKWIGAVAIRWNSIEDLLDWLVCVGLGIDIELLAEVGPRISGLDAKLDIWAAIAQHDRWPDAAAETLSQLRAAIRQHADYRNTVVHSNISDAPSAIGTLRRRGVLHDISLRADALEILFNRIDIVSNAMGPVFQVTHWARATRGPFYENGTIFQRPPTWRPEFDDKIAEARELLDQLPDFPADVFVSG